MSEETVVKIDKIDKDIPSAPAVTGDNNGWVSANTVLTANSTDKGSGISQYSFSSALNEFNWQNENTFSITKDATKLFVYSKDKAGNISEPQVVEYRFDESLPSGFVSAENPSDWVRYVNITADGNDEVSGLHEAPYSFSRSEGTYSWQKDNVYKADASGTYYVYVRDSAGNITLLDTVTIDKIDSTAPTIDNIDIKDDNDRTIITVTAKDSQSGVAEYSIDNGKTWQQSNVFEIEKDALNYIAVKVKDDSMENTLLKDSYVFVEFNANLNNKDIGIFSYNNEILIKRFVIRKDKLILRSDNKAYADIDIDENSDFTIIGRVHKGN